MRDDAPSGTAAWVAAMRGLASCLPDDLRLVSDPYGLRFGGLARVFEGREGMVRATWRMWLFAGLRNNVHLLQLRTRALDDMVRAFVAGGGRQLVILGAGFDCRAWRLADQLGGATVFEVDHPATQAKKRALMKDERSDAARFLEWNFETDPLEDLPARLAAVGHQSALRTLTILEGVLPYLTDDATDATFAAVHALSAPASPFAFTYLERQLVNRAHTERVLVSLLGEPYKNGFDPDALSAWISSRGFRLDQDIAMPALAVELLPASHAKALRRAGRHVALAIRC